MTRRQGLTGYPRHVLRHRPAPRACPPRAARRSLPVQLAAVCVPLLLSLVFAASAPAAAKLIWGPFKTADGASAFPLYRELGVDYLQTQIVWSRVAPTRPADPRSPLDPAYVWPRQLDAAVAEARGYGVQIALMVKSSPGWANGGRGPEWAPTSAADYANFLVAASRRYPSVRRWMIWGETNRAASFSPLPADSPVGPRRYAKLLDAAYVALKGVDREDLVIGGMTFTYGDVKPPAFLKWMRLPNGRAPRLDLYGHNPFARRKPKLALLPSVPGSRDMSDMDTFGREVHRAYATTARFRRSGPRLWLSEFTVSSDHRNRGFTFAVSRSEQAAWLTSAFSISDRLREVAGIGWYNLLDEPVTTANGLTTGLVTWEGKRKPAFYAYKRLATR